MKIVYFFFTEIRLDASYNHPVPIGHLPNVLIVIE